MNSKHAVATGKHTGQTVHHKKHTTHMVRSGNHHPHTVHAANQATAMLRPFESLGNVFEDMMDMPITEQNTINMPPVDIRETDRTIEVSVALSGVEKKDIHLDLTEDSLAISCERRDESNEKGPGGYRLQEQSYGRFYRAFTLPAEIKTSDAKAMYKNGVLRIPMQKQKPYGTLHITVE